MSAFLYLIPSTIGDYEVKDVLPRKTLDVIQDLDEFIVENIRTSRRFLIKAGYTKSIDNIKFNLLDKHTSESELPGFLDSAKSGKSIGLISEAGCPCVADPGARVVALAHQAGIKVKPLTGPSSILLALMASGFNGQSFAFHGYLPIDTKQQQKRLKEIEKQARLNDQTQIFMEAPYRNNKMLRNIVMSLSEATMLCIASEITTDGEFIETKSIGLWKKNLPDCNKKNTVFLIFA